MTTSTTKITKRDRYVEIADLVALAKEQGFEGFDFEGLTEFCEKEIDALARKAEKAKETAAKKKAESDELTDIVLSELTDELEPIAALSKEGKATKGEVVIPATETTKKRTVVAYSL